MRFFRLIPLPKFFAVCILAFSATSTQAQNFSDFLIDSLKKDGYRALDFFFYHIGVYETKPEELIRLYRFLEEAKTNKKPELELPTPEIAAILKNHTTYPVKESYLGYLKLHNETVSDRWRDAICWEKIILRIHYDNKVTGWAIKDSGKSTYRTYQVSEDITDAFCGEESDNSRISYMFVTKNATEPTGGHNKCNLAWDSSRKVLSGKWEGGSSVNKMVSPAKQQGNIHIDMHQHRYSDSFDINEETIAAFEKNENRNETSIKTLLTSKDTSKDNLSENLKLIITWYVVQAWNTYYNTEHLPQDLKNKKNTILNFRVCLTPQFYSEYTGSEVPLQYGSAPYFPLNISINTFFTLDDSSKYKSTTSMIAHEILGHGIVNKFKDRQTEYLINLIKELKEEKYKDLIEKIKTNPEQAKRVATEGLASAVEYAVYKKLYKQPDNIFAFVQTRYSSDDGQEYRQGVQILCDKGYVDKETGEIKWDKISEDMNKDNNNN